MKDRPNIFLAQAVSAFAEIVDKKKDDIPSTVKLNGKAVFKGKYKEAYKFVEDAADHNEKPYEIHVDMGDGYELVEKDFSFVKQ